MNDDLWLTRDCQSISDGQGYSDKGYYTICMADDPWLSGDCQSISDGQGYSDKGYYTICMADDPWLTGDCQSIPDSQGYSDKGTIQYVWLTICGCPGIVRVSLTVRDTLTGVLYNIHG